MPFYGLSTSSAGNRAVRRAPLPYIPSGSSSGSSSYQPRNFPERIDANNVGGTDLVAQGISAAARAPGYIYERPLAAIDAITGGGKPGSKGVIEQGIDTLKGVPILGDAIKGVGNVLEGSARLAPALVNSQMANNLKDTANLPASQPLDDFQKFLYGNNASTVGDLRRLAFARGFTQQDITDLAAGRKGTYDFADKSMSDNRLLDLGGRLALDPLNATLIAGPAVLGALGKVGKINELGQSTARVLKLADARAIVAASPVLAKPALGVREGVAALRAGVVEGVTNKSLGTFLMGMGRGGSALLGSYRKVAVGTTAAQIGVNLVDDMIADKSAVPGAINDLFLLGREMRDDTPLSDSSLFSLWAVMHFPAREMIGQVTNAAAGKYRLHIPTGRDIESRLVDLLEPGARSEYPARLARMHERLGGVESYLDFLRHIHGKWTIETPGKVTGGLAAAITERPVIRGMIDTAEHGKMLNELVDAGIKYDPINGRDFVDTVKRYATGARNVKEFTNGMEQVFNPETVYQQWTQFRPVASAMDAVAGGAVVPQIRRTLIKEHLDVAKWRFRKAAGADGKVSVADAQRIINDYPALWQDESTAQFWAKVTARDHEALPVGSYIQRLNKAQKNAFRLTDVLAPQEQWAAKAAREAEYRKGFIGPDGKPNLDLIPTDGQSRVMTPTAANVNKRAAGFAPDTLPEVYEARSNTLLDNTDTMADLEAAGYDVRIAKQGVGLDRGSLAPAIEITTGNIGPQGLAEVAAHLVKRAKSTSHARTVISGSHMTSRGLTANAAEAVWRVGGHTEAQKQAVIEVLNRIFGEGYVDDASGVYRVYVAADTTGGAAMIERARAELGAIFPERAPTGVFEGEVNRVWTETIRDTNRSRSGRDARAAGTERSIRAVADAARYSTNWHVARNRFAERRAADRRAAMDVAAQPGPDNEPLRQAGGPDSGPQLGAVDPGPGVGVTPVARGDTADAVKIEMGVPDTGGPLLASRPGEPPMIGDPMKYNKLRAQPGTERPPEYLFRAVSEEHWQAIQREGSMRSDGRGNLSSSEGTVAALDDPSAYLGLNESGRLLRIKYDPADGWLTGTDGYIKTQQAIPLAHIDMVSPRLDVHDSVMSPSVIQDVGVAQPVPASLDQVPGFTPQDRSALGGELKWMIDRDAEVANFHPNLGTGNKLGKDEAGPQLFDSFSPEDQHKLDALQEQLTRYDPTYTIGLGPKGSTPFRIGQGKAYAQTALAKQITGDLISTVVTSKAADFWHTLFGRVYTKDLANDAKQELFSDFVTAGASPGQVARFMRALSDEAKDNRWWGVHLAHRMDLLPPEIIDRIARQGRQGFDGFDKKVLDALGGAPHKSLTRASSRFYRKLEQNHRAVDGAGSLGQLLDKTYGPMTRMANGRVGTAGNFIRFFYPLFRFKLDPRWHLMNRFEADILGAARFGIRKDQSIVEGRIDPAVAHISGRSGDLSTSLDNMASGFLDARRLEAYIGPAFKAERVNSTRTALEALAENDPIMVMLRRRAGKPGATAKDLVDELDKMMYDFDSKGVERTILDEVEAQRQIDNIDYSTPEFKPMLQRLTKMHKQQFSESVRVFHGNTNRSNIERMLNSYFLYWPISYQLKVAKTLVDVLTKSFGGRKTDLLGAWGYDRLMQEHKRRLVDDPEYAQMFMDHPELWRAAGMFLPITPMDVGVSASRVSRYAASSLGAAIGLWDKDADYPDLTTPLGAMDAGTRIAKLGVPYSVDLLNRVAKEFKDK